MSQLDHLTDANIERVKSKIEIAIRRTEGQQRRGALTIVDRSRVDSMLLLLRQALKELTPVSTPKDESIASG